jgi:hypothetical protein
LIFESMGNYTTPPINITKGSALMLLHTVCTGMWLPNRGLAFRNEYADPNYRQHQSSPSAALKAVRLRGKTRQFPIWHVALGKSC